MTTQEFTNRTPILRFRPRIARMPILLSFLLLTMSLPPIQLPMVTVETQAAGAAARIVAVITQLLAKYGARYGTRFAAFINTIVRNLLSAGAKTIQQAYRTKAATIVEHQIKLAAARQTARLVPSAKNIGLVQYYEKEIERLILEHQILRDAMNLMGIPVP